MVRPRAVGLLVGLALACPLPFVRAEERPLRQVVDAELRAAWKREKVTPAARAGDAEFLRRAYLDLVGTIPTYEEAQKFLADTAPDKRAKLVDRLMADPRFGTHQADVWDRVFFSRSASNTYQVHKRDRFKKWLAGKFDRNEPYDKWARALLLAEEEGPEYFYVQHRGQPEDATEAVSRIFLGTQVHCARCHDHPFEDWTQRDFFGMAGFFVRLVVEDKTVGREQRFRIAEKDTGEVLFAGSVKEARPGRKGEPVRPKFLGGPMLDEPPAPKAGKGPVRRPRGPLPKPAFSRKEKLAAWVTAADNPYFARAVVNRTWAQLVGRGFVHPVDDLSKKKEPSHPELMEALTKQLVAHKFDLKWLIREVVNSEAYQLSAAGPGKDALPHWYERARVRPLSAEELLSALRTATGFDATGQKMRGDTFEYMRMYFGEPYNGLGDFQGGLAEHLFLNNSDNVRALIRRTKGNLADTLLKSTEPWDRRVDRLFLSVLSRPPRAEERARFVAHLTSGKTPRDAEPLLEEAIWALLNTAEFRFNH